MPIFQNMKKTSLIIATIVLFTAVNKAQAMAISRPMTPPPSIKTSTSETVQTSSSANTSATVENSGIATNRPIVITTDDISEKSLNNTTKYDPTTISSAAQKNGEYKEKLTNRVTNKITSKQKNKSDTGNETSTSNQNTTSTSSEQTTEKTKK